MTFDETCINCIYYLAMKKYKQKVKDALEKWKYSKDVQKELELDEK